MKTLAPYFLKMAPFLPAGLALLALLTPLLPATARAGTETQEAAPVAPPPAGEQQAPPPAAQTDEDKAAPPQYIDEQRFVKVFTEPGAYARYKDAEFDAVRAELNKNFEMWNPTDKEPPSGPEANEARSIWARSVLDQLGYGTPADLSNTRVAVEKTDAVAKNCAEKIYENDPECRQVEGQIRADRTNSTKIEQDPASTPPTGGLTGKMVPVPDKEPTKEAGLVVDDKFRSLLKMGTLGAMAGAMVGIGLLPLFGPAGILIGALLGAAMVVVSKKLGG